MSSPSRAAVLAAALAVLAAAPACDKKKSPPAPDTGPPPAPDPKSKRDPDPRDTGAKQDPPADPSLPAPPAQRPLYSTAAAAPVRLASQNNLKEIALGFYAAHDALGKFPAGVADKSGKVGLSWRVALLPYVEQGALYKEFRLDEPWDSEHNRKLIPKMPKVYAPGRTDTFGYTFYRSFSGPGTVMPPPARPGQPGQTVGETRLTSITDGASNTLLVAEAYDPVIWTKPDELPFAPGKLPKLGGVFGNGFNAALCDGSVRFLRGLDDATLSLAIQVADGKPFDFPSSP